MARNALLLLTIICIVTGDDSWSKLQINTPSLGIVQGEISPQVSNIRQFIGIPFAQPPIGALRFKPPVSPNPVVNTSPPIIYNATAAANQGGFPLLRCMQISLSNPSIINGQEDCLYLDIFLPLNISNGTLLPVVIYIYGGGFQVADLRNPSQIVSSYQNIIYVAIRYRLNAFGFMASTSLSASRSGPIQSSGLQGFEDQQMAMKWVHNNIQSFGGDPNRVTLQGHSAGAISVCLHLIAPASQGLFQRAIIESGGCDISQIPLEQMEIIGDQISSYFCNSSSNVISCLQTINATLLLQYVQSKDYLNFFTANAIHLPIDGLIIPDSITNLFQQQKFASNISLLTGTTKDEFGLFIAGKFEPGWQVTNLSQTVLSEWVQLFSNGQSAYLNATYNPYNDSSIEPTSINYYGLTDALSTSLFQCPVRRTAAYLSNNGTGSVYLYSFDYVPLPSYFANFSQSVHGQELPFVFNTPNSSASTEILFRANTFNEDEQLLASAISLLWIRFIVNGDPNTPLNAEETNPLITQLSQLRGWPRYSTNTPAGLSSYIIFSNIASENGTAIIELATSGYHSPTCAEWDQILPNPTIVKRCAVGYNGPDCSTASSSKLNAVSHLIFSLLPILIYALY